MARAVRVAGTRAHLLKTGRALAVRHGLRGLTVRGLAQRAGVNLGTFVYHFGTRDAFVTELIEDWYAPLYARLQAISGTEGPPLAQLAQLIQKLVEFLVEQRRFVLHVLADALAGEAGARRFLQSLTDRHPVLLLQAIRRAQAARELRPGHPLHLMIFLLMSVAAPLLLFTSFGRADVLPREFKRAAEALAADPALAKQRLEWALKGLAA